LRRVAGGWPGGGAAPRLARRVVARAAGGAARPLAGPAGGGAPRRAGRPHPVTFTLHGELSPMTRVERWGLALALALVAALMVPLRGYLTDDTFIHLQYARHLAAGQGLVFNLGERVYGCTSPLWAA